MLEAIAAKIQEEHGLAVDPPRQIIVTPGAKQAILITLMAVINSEDEVLAPSPCWLSYGDMTTIAGGKLVHIGSNKDTGFVPVYEDMERSISIRTKAIIINNPCNPTGAVWSQEQLSSVARLAQEHDLLVISDETYDKIVFDDHRFIGMASLEGLANRTVTINSFSKTYAMTGWRIGYLIGPERLVEAIAKIHQHSATCVTAFGQMAALAALTGPQECVAGMVAEYQKRCDLLVAGLNSIERVSCPGVKGTFYALMDVNGLGMDSMQAADFFLKTAHVAMTPGAAYGESGEGYLRISFATSQDTISKGLRRIEMAATVAS